MGLDMYLTKRKYVGAQYEHREVKGSIYITIKGKELPIDFNKVSYIEEDIGYWRKANQIHDWFVRNYANGEDNCRPIYLELEDLKKLLDVCKKVRKSINLVDGKVIQSYTYNEKGEKVITWMDGKVIEDTSVCEELLPTCNGFFFGDTEYNEWYVEQIDYTIKMLKDVIKEEEKMRKNDIYNDFYYCASW
jgi:hypothetical protein